MVSMAWLALACSSKEPANAPRTWLQTPTSELPVKLSTVGLDQPAPAFDTFDYTPFYPLWSDGGTKSRTLLLPAGTSIDASNPAAYVFPLGTLVFKTFSFATPSHRDDVVPIETRVLWLTEDGWQLNAYGWDDDGKDAELLDLKRSVTRPIVSDQGEVAEHVIPSRLECRQCHESSMTEVLGINELQLATSGAIEDLKAHLEPQPAAPYARLPEHGPRTEVALGYLVGNCVHCHNGTNGAASSFDLRPDVALQNLIDQPTASSATADGIRVVPGKPEESVMFLGIRGMGEREVKTMPPLGVSLRDDSAVQSIADWITALGDNNDP